MTSNAGDGVDARTGPGSAALDTITGTPDDRILVFTRVVAAVVVAILFIAWFALYLHPGETDHRFAWTISSRMTAMLMGAGYGSAILFYLQVLLGRRWHRVALGFLPTALDYVYLPGSPLPNFVTSWVPVLPTSPDGTPVNTRWNAHRRYTAARITPIAPTIAYGLSMMNVPINDRNSPMKPEKPGSPIDANAAAQKSPPSTGTDFHNPPKPEISRVCRRS